MEEAHEYDNELGEQGGKNPRKILYKSRVF